MGATFLAILICVFAVIGFFAVAFVAICYIAAWVDAGHDRMED